MANTAPQPVVMARNVDAENQAGWVGLPDAVAMLAELNYVNIGKSGDQQETQGQGTQAQNAVASVASTGMMGEFRSPVTGTQGTSPINDPAGKQIATLHFSSTNRELNQLSAKVRRRHSAAPLNAPPYKAVPLTHHHLALAPGLPDYFPM